MLRAPTQSALRPSPKILPRSLVPIGSSKPLGDQRAQVLRRGLRRHPAKRRRLGCGNRSALFQKGKDGEPGFTLQGRWGCRSCAPRASRNNRGENISLPKNGVSPQERLRILLQISETAAQLFGIANLREKIRENGVFRDGVEICQGEPALEQRPARVFRPQTPFVNHKLCGKRAGELSMNERVG